MKSDPSDTDLAKKIIDDRPATANDRCNGGDGTGLTMAECTGAADGSPRMSAGEAITDDAIECVLKPLDRASYAVTLTDAQWSALRSLFPNGVCDYSASGTGRQLAQPWMTFVDFAGGPVVEGAQLPLPPAGSGASW